VERCHNRSKTVGAQVIVVRQAFDRSKCFDRGQFRGHNEEAIRTWLGNLVPLDCGHSTQLQACYQE
jgi:hypothetical protein